jgi:hypothetical protein
LVTPPPPAPSNAGLNHIFFKLFCGFRVFKTDLEPIQFRYG